MTKKHAAILISQTFENYLGELEADDFFDGYVRLFQRTLQNNGFDYSIITLNDYITDETLKNFDVVLLNLAWDYHLNRDGFLSFLKRVEKNNIKLFNSYKTVCWNSKKTYLLDLKLKGINTIDTLYVEKKENPILESFLKEKKWEAYILKPAVSAAGYKTFKANSIAEAQAIYDAHYEEDQTIMIQPFLPEIMSEGEWSFMFFNGTYSHNVLKQPNCGEFKVKYAWNNTKYDDAENWMIEYAKKVLVTTQEIIGEVPLYARIDLVRKNDELILMEAELIEPFLYLFKESSFEKLVHALKEKLSIRGCA